MVKAKISEVFRSVQGEGKYAGIQQVFVRFYGCNMRCDWCDTPQSLGGGRYREYEAQELFKRVKKLWKNCHPVSLTGGEPLVQTDFLKYFLPLLKKTGMTIYLETNGVLPLELKRVIRDVDIVSMDIKLPSSTECRPFWREHEEFLKIAKRREVFVKTVIARGTSRADVIRAAKLVSKIKRDTVFILQPNCFEAGKLLTKKLLQFQGECSKYLNDVRVIPQMHKYLKIR